jgi:hypothetical protein
MLMLVHSSIAITALYAYGGLRNCAVVRSYRGPACLSALQFTAAAPSALRANPEPKIQFSVPLSSLETRPDCYRVYTHWCDDAEDDLRFICTRCVRSMETLFLIQYIPTLS